MRDRTSIYYRQVQLLVNLNKMPPEKRAEAVVMLSKILQLY